MTRPVTALQLLKACIVQLKENNAGQPVRVCLGDDIFINSDDIEHMIENPSYALIGKIDFDELTWETIKKQLGVDYNTAHIGVIVK